MQVFSLPTFLKLCHLDQSQLLAEIDKRLNAPKGGYAYHWSLKHAIEAFIDGKPQSHIEGILNSPTREFERKHNKAAFDNFMCRFSNNKTLETVSESELYAIQSSGIGIRVEPWFATTENNERFLHVVWATSRPELEQRNANIGCYILQETFKSSKYGNSRFCIMDLTKPKRFSDKTVSAKTPLALSNIADSIARCVKQV